MPGASTDNGVEQILYGHTGPRIVYQPTLLQDDAYRKLKPYAQNYLLVLAQLRFYSGSDNTSFPSNMLAAHIEYETGRIFRSAQIMRGLQNKDLVQGIQGRDMARVQWRLTQAGVQAQPLIECACGCRQHLYLGKCMQCREPLFGWNDKGQRLKA